MKLKNIKLLLASSLIMFSFSALANEDGEPIYECSTKELSEFIKAETAQLRMNSKMPVADEVQRSVLAAKLRGQSNNPSGSSGAAGECLAVWGDDMAGVDFRGLYDGISDMFEGLGSGSWLQIIMNEVKNEVQDQVYDLMDSFMDNACDLLDASVIEDMIYSKIETDYGFDAERFLSSPNGAFEDALYDKYGGNSRYILDPDLIGEDIPDEIDRAIRDKEDDFWGN